VSAHYTQTVIINGKRNFIWLCLIILTVFMDPMVIDGFPSLEFEGKKISYIRELLQLGIAISCLRFAKKTAMQSNEFSFEPILEVAFLFVGIFLTMIPALQLLEHYGSLLGNISPGMIYFGSGIFSAVLDNAPTYVNFFTLVMSVFHLSVSNVQDVHAFISSEQAIYLVAISVGSVFWGAMTYIGNGPNFMVKAIAESAGVKMPPFFQYIYKYSLPFLLPVLVVVWLIFFY
jgi:Na+/H+ antiporter NhaD/arsenite permease-like protein